MMRNIFKFKRVNPAPGKKSDRIILILCFSVLALLVARNLLVFFKPSPATITKKPPEKIATVHEPRYKIKTPAGPLKGTKKTGNEKPQEGNQPVSTDAAGPEKAALPGKKSVPLPPPGAASVMVLPPNPSMASKIPQEKTIEGEPEAELPRLPQAGVSVKPPETPIKKESVVSNLEKPSAPKTEKRSPAPLKAKIPLVKDTISPSIDPRVYSVQVGTYIGMRYADRMVKAARDKGFEASVLKLKDGNEKIWYVVQTGDYATKAEAEREAIKFQESSGISPAVVRISTKLLAERKIEDTDGVETGPGSATVSEKDPPTRNEEPPERVDGEPPADIHPVNQTTDASPAISTTLNGSGSPSETGLAIPDLRDRIRRAAYAEAARSYRQQLARFPGRYTIRLEVDCSDESVQTAFIQGSYDPHMFILPIRFKDRACYLVLWGLYESERDATDALSDLPPFFKAQTYPPAPVLLDTYMNP